MWALVNEDGTVENMVLWDGLSDWTPPRGRLLVLAAGQDVDIGWTYADGTFLPPHTARSSDQEPEVL